MSKSTKKKGKGAMIALGACAVIVAAGAFSEKTDDGIVSESGEIVSGDYYSETVETERFDVEEWLHKDEPEASATTVAESEAAAEKPAKPTEEAAKKVTEKSSEKVTEKTVEKAKSTKKSTAKATEATVGGDSGEIMVWIPTNGGTKYHSKSSCSSMDDPMYVTLDEAKSMGFTACKRCYG